jgi:C-terminal processing protease CtpA/Prc
MLEELGDTDALILDLRGYPNGTGWVLAHFLNVRGAEVGALFRRREVGSESAYFKDSGFFFAQGLPELAEEPYTGEVVVLIDERAISQSEHVALFLEQAAGAVFIGSPTAGANGDITNFWLPGGIFVVFTGHDVRHADGRQLQRVGILTGRRRRADPRRPARRPPRGARAGAGAPRRRGGTVTRS